MKAAPADRKPAERMLADEVRLPVLLGIIVRRNPDVQAAWQGWRSVLRQFEQASFLEDTIVQFRSFVRELDTKVGPQTHREMPAKTFAFPSALALRGQLVEIAARLAELKHDLTLRKALNDAARGYYQVRYFLRTLSVMRQNRALLSDMETLTQTQLQVGKVSQADSLKAQSALVELDRQIATMELDRSAEQARVNSLMALDTGAAWGELATGDLVDPGRPPRELLQRALASNQDLEMATREVQQMDAMVRMAETMAFPRGSAGMSLIAPSVGAEAGPTRSMMATFPTTPAVDASRAGLGANAAYIDELRVRAVQARRNRDAVRARIGQDIAQAHARVDIARRTLVAYEKEIVPRGRQAYDAMRERYNTALAPFIEFLDAARTYLDGVVKAEEARRDLNRSLLDLQDALGAGPGELLPGR